MENKLIILIITIFIIGLFLCVFVSAENKNGKVDNDKYDEEILDKFNFTDAERGNGNTMSHAENIQVVEG